MTSTAILTWLQVFTSKDYMTLLAPFLHAHDIVMMSWCCHQMNEFLLGSKIKEVLCVIVKRDLNANYIASPLGYLGIGRNVTPRQYPDGKKRYNAPICALCSHRTTENDTHIALTPAVYGLCCKCNSDAYQGFDERVCQEVFERCKEKYARSSMLRIERIIGRWECRRGDIVNLYDTMRCRNGQACNVVDRVMSEIRALDLQPKLVMKFDRTLVDSFRLKRQLEAYDEEDAVRKLRKNASNEETFLCDFDIDFAL